MSDEKKKSSDGNRTAIESVAGLLDPNVRVLGEKAGSEFASRVPSTHWSRSKTAERVFGVARQWVVSISRNLNPFLSTVVKKSMDFFDHASGEIFGHGTEKHSPGKSSAPTLEKAFDGWMENFFKDADARFKAAKPDELNALGKSLKDEFAIRKELLEALKKEFEKPEVKEETKSEPPIDWKAKSVEFNAKWHRKLKKLERKIRAWTRRQKAKAAVITPETSFDRVLSNPFRLLKVLAGVKP